MTLKKRLLRIFLTVTLVVAFVGYFAFSTFLFSPLEGGIKGDVSTLVPRNVDFFVARANVSSVFSSFPRLRVMDRLEQHQGWQTFLASPEYAEFAQKNDIGNVLAQAQQMQADIPMGMRMTSLFGGKDVAIAGYFRGDDLAKADIAVYGHMNWLGKLGIELLAYPGLLGLDAQGITVGKEDGYLILSGGQLQRELFVKRVKDVGVVSTSLELIEAVDELQKSGAQDSFGQSARYQDFIENANRSMSREDFEVYFDLLKYAENMKLTGKWPDTGSEKFTSAFLGRFFQRDTLKEMIGVVDVDEGLSLDVHGEFSSEKISQVQLRNYRALGFDRSDILTEVAHIAPSDACLVVYMHGRAGDLLRETLAAMDGEMRNLIEEAMRCTGRYNSLEEVVTELEGSLRDRFALIVRPNDYRKDPEGPPHNDDIVFAASLVTWYTDKKGEEKLNAMRDAIGNRGDCFGLKGRTPGEAGYFRNYEGGFETREFWNELIPGTGVIGTVTTSKQFIVTNQFSMLGHVVKTMAQGAPDYPRLSDRPDFTALVNSSLPEANVMVWLNPKTAADTLRRQAEQSARYEVESRIDWRVERARVEDEVIREHFPGKRRGRLSPEEQARLDELVNPILENKQERIYAEQIPAFKAERERLLAYLESIQGGLMMLSLDPKHFDLSVRVIAPLP